MENQPEAYRLDQSKAQLAQAQANLADLEKGQRLTVLQGIQGQLEQVAADLQFAQKHWGETVNY
ncbi:MAG: hypothetical protein HWD59_09695 [Coxiellaceae bacterium]|nr:MAG: hypothetical protein HWD59_09695 [Coxiellaceae bacterium]